MKCHSWERGDITESTTRIIHILCVLCESNAPSEKCKSHEPIKFVKKGEQFPWGISEGHTGTATWKPIKQFLTRNLVYNPWLSPSSRLRFFLVNNLFFPMFMSFTPGRKDREIWSCLCAWSFQLMHKGLGSIFNARFTWQELVLSLVRWSLP